MSKTVLITGCSSGIGYSCAYGLDELGYRVFATCRKEEDVVRLQKEGFNAHKLDLLDVESMHEALDWMLAQTDGCIDILFNNAAFGQPGAVEDLTYNALREQFETNVFGTQMLTNLVIPIMRAQKRGKIIYNSSILGFIAMRYRGAYNASKFAIEGLADTLRLELHGSGIDVVLVEPGPIRSNFRRNALDKFLQHVDCKNSVHKKVYQKKLECLHKSCDTFFTLEPEAVLAVVVKAIVAKKPKARYHVNFPTKLFSVLKRIFPTSWIDKIARNVSE